jgi:hypothetical protein
MCPTRHVSDRCCFVATLQDNNQRGKIITDAKIALCNLSNMLIPCPKALDEPRSKLPIEHMERSSTAFSLEG